MTRSHHGPPTAPGSPTTQTRPVRLPGRTYNTAAVLRDGQILGFAAKQFLANDGVHYETRFFAPWVADLLFATVALIWLVPDPRIERIMAGRRLAPGARR